MSKDRDWYTYEEFLKRACRGEVPTRLQEEFIRDFLSICIGQGARESDVPIMLLSGKGSGKTSLRRWVIRFLCFMEEVESNNYNGWWLSEMEGGVKVRG